MSASKDVGPPTNGCEDLGYEMIERAALDSHGRLLPPKTEVIKNLHLVRREDVPQDPPGAPAGPHE